MTFVSQKNLTKLMQKMLWQQILDHGFTRVQIFDVQ